jgi:molecular chaperone DnaK
MARILGIDLGTTNSVAAVYVSGQARLIESAERGRSTPTVIGEPEAGALVVGAPARWQAQTNPQFTFAALKRILGRRFDDPLVAQHVGSVPYQIEESPDGWAWVRTRKGLKSPQEILANVLRKMKAAAQAHFGDQVGHCVLTVPAHFTQVQKAAAEEVATLAGFQVLRLLSEPTAAAIAYGFERAASDRTIAVFDFGGGTFDVSILQITGRDYEVLATDGEPFLGGEDFDRRVVNMVADRFDQAHGVDLRRDRVQLQRLRDEAEKAKIQLSSVERFDVLLPWVAINPTTQRQLDLVDVITRADLGKLTADLVEKARAPCERALRAAKLDVRDLDDVVLVGGMTAMPAIQQLVVDVFGRDPRRDVPPEEVVAIGAAIRAAALQGEIRSVTVAEPLAHTLGVEDGAGDLVPILKARTPTPARRTVRFATAEDGQTACAIRLFEGDRAAAADNRALGYLVLQGLPPAAAGVQEVEVEFELDPEGVLTAAARARGCDAGVSGAVNIATGLAPDALGAPA